jgi:hypothetical protein
MAEFVTVGDVRGERVFVVVECELKVRKPIFGGCLVFADVRDAMSWSWRASGGWKGCLSQPCQRWSCVRVRLCLLWDIW